MGTLIFLCSARPESNQPNRCCLDSLQEVIRAGAWAWTYIRGPVVNVLCCGRSVRARPTVLAFFRGYRMDSPPITFYIHPENLRLGLTRPFGFPIIHGDDPRFTVNVDDVQVETVAEAVATIGYSAAALLVVADPPLLQSTLGLLYALRAAKGLVLNALDAGDLTVVHLKGKTINGFEQILSTTSQVNALALLRQATMPTGE